MYQIISIGKAEIKSFTIGIIFIEIFYVKIFKFYSIRISLWAIVAQCQTINTMVVDSFAMRWNELCSFRCSANKTALR